MSKIHELSDNELIQLLKKDDNAAFTEIYNRYVESLAGFAGAQLYHLEEAHDILHDIFVKLWEDRDTLDISGSLKSYLFSATRNRVIDRIRRRITRQDYALMLQATKPPESYGADKVIEAKELQENIEKALNELPRRAKQIYRLSRDQHQTTLEIAQMLNISEQTVKNQLTTALKHLRQSIGRLSIAALSYWWL